MTTSPTTARPDASGLLVRAFPPVGPAMRLAYRELAIAATGTAEQRRALGDPDLLARPWDLGTCTDPGLRGEVWDWLEAVVIWLNTEYGWDITSMIPPCWPHHPHLVHEIATVADQRRRAGLATGSEALEEWHRYALPAFTDRMRSRLRTHCDEGHQPWPATGRHTRHVSPADVQNRRHAYAGDVHATVDPAAADPAARTPPRPARLAVVDLDTGEIKP